MTLELLAYGDDEIQEFMYLECHTLVEAVLGVQYNDRYCWKHLIFLMNSSVLTEIICHGTTHENNKVFIFITPISISWRECVFFILLIELFQIKKLAEDVILLFLKGKLQLGNDGWFTFMESLIPVLPLLQSLADPSTSLGQSITKMLDPDISLDIKLPFSEVRI